MNSISIKTYTAQATIGLYKAYSNEPITLSDFKKVVFQSQEKIKKELGVALSIKLTSCEIVFLGQEEPSVTLDFIQYPKFPTTEKLLKEAILQLVQLLMESLDQIRTVIVFPDDTFCLEKSDEIDPKIQL